MSRAMPGTQWVLNQENEHVHLYSCPWARCSRVWQYQGLHVWILWFHGTPSPQNP